MTPICSDFINLLHLWVLPICAGSLFAAYYKSRNSCLPYILYLRQSRGYPYLIIMGIQAKEQSLVESIDRKIALLKYETEHKLSQQPNPGTQIYVTGNIGTINTGQMQIDNSMNIKLDEFKKADQMELFHAFSSLVQAINQTEVMEKSELTEKIDSLINQCKTPKEERNYGVIKTVERVLSNAASVSAIWEQVGPVIMKAIS